MPTINVRSQLISANGVTKPVGVESKPRPWRDKGTSEGVSKVSGRAFLTRDIGEAFRIAMPA
jgi:hypothetical protein